ncbi:MAG TPA: helix-turn-helix domain-containing protein [Candidatus Binataceae bacterium]|nr:helix-turn-helix domain-containing protein [Candidatus Binataceae bacterium]
MPSAPGEGQTLGQFLTNARERRGVSREQLIVEAHIPEHYLKMIESDDYGLVSDQLYLVPYIRRYAVFVGLDSEEVAARFVREVQSAETSVVRISEPFTMVTHRNRGGGFSVATGVWVATLLALVLFILIGVLAIRRMNENQPVQIETSPPPMKIVKAAAPTVTPTVAPTAHPAPPSPTVGATPTPAKAPAEQSDAPPGDD